LSYERVPLSCERMFEQAAELLEAI
jgi:hypothetical protein